MKLKLRLEPSAAISLASVYLAAGERFWALLAAVAVHELGHFAALQAVGAEIDAVTVSWTGLQMSYRRSLSYFREVICAAAGPAAGLVLAVACLNCDGILYETGRLSAALTVFNLLPAGALDGAAILRGIISRWLHPEKLDRVMAVCTCAAALAVMAAPIALQLPLRYAAAPAFAGLSLLFSVAKTR